MAGITKIPGTIEVVDGNVDTLLTRLTDTRAGYLDNLATSGSNKLSLFCNYYLVSVYSSIYAFTGSGYILGNIMDFPPTIQDISVHINYVADMDASSVADTLSYGCCLARVLVDAIKISGAYFYSRHYVTGFYFTNCAYVRMTPLSLNATFALYRYV